MIKTIKELQKLLTAMKIMQEEGNQDDMTPVIEEQLRAFDTVIDAVENFEDEDIDILMEDYCNR